MSPGKVRLRWRLKDLTKTQLPHIGTINLSSEGRMRQWAFITKVSLYTLTKTCNNDWCCTELTPFRYIEFHGHRQKGQISYLTYPGRSWSAFPEDLETKIDESHLSFSLVGCKYPQAGCGSCVHFTMLLRVSVDCSWILSNACYETWSTNFGCSLEGMLTSGNVYVCRIESSQKKRCTVAIRYALI